MNIYNMYGMHGFIDLEAGQCKLHQVTRSDSLTTNLDHDFHSIDF